MASTITGNLTIVKGHRPSIYGEFVLNNKGMSDEYQVSQYQLPQKPQHMTQSQKRRSTFQNPTAMQMQNLPNHSMISATSATAGGGVIGTQDFVSRSGLVSDSNYDKIPLDLSAIQAARRDSCKQYQINATQILAESSRIVNQEPSLAKLHNNEQHVSALRKGEQEVDNIGGLKNGRSGSQVLTKRAQSLLSKGNRPQFTQKNSFTEQYKSILLQQCQIEVDPNEPDTFKVDQPQYQKPNAIQDFDQGFSKQNPYLAASSANASQLSHSNSYVISTNQSPDRQPSGQIDSTKIYRNEIPNIKTNGARSSQNHRSNIPSESQISQSRSKTPQEDFINDQTSNLISRRTNNNRNNSKQQSTGRAKVSSHNRNQHVHVISTNQDRIPSPFNNNNQRQMEDSAGGNIFGNLGKHHKQQHNASFSYNQQQQLSPSPKRSMHAKQPSSGTNVHQNNPHFNPFAHQPMVANTNPTMYNILHKKRSNGGGFSSHGHRTGSFHSKHHSNTSKHRQIAGGASSNPSALSQFNITIQNTHKEEEQKQDDQNKTINNGKTVKEIVYQKPGVKIGQGKYHPIELIIYKNDIYALKKIPKASIDKAKRIEHLKNEKKVGLMVNEIAQKQGVSFFIRLEETFTDAESLNFIFEYCPGQDIFWVIQNEMNLFLGKKKTPNGSSQKDWVKFYAAEVLIALEALHRNKIIYRDLKPENVVIDKEGHIKLIDFGFAKRLSSTNKHRTFTNCGTVGYTAPEVLLETSQGYSFEADIWSFGIFLSELLSGKQPFDRMDDPQVIEDQILQCDLKMPRDVDQTTRDLLQQIFVLDPNLRITIADIKQHKFFADVDWRSVESRKLEPVPYKPNPLKYRYLLQNKYESVSNVTTSQSGEQRSQSPLKVDSPKKNSVLGDFTMYKVNKEFENF